MIVAFGMHYHPLSAGVENYHMAEPPRHFSLVWLCGKPQPREGKGREAIIFSLVCNAMGLAALE